MFESLFEEYAALLEGRGSSPEQQRLAYRLSKGLTKKAGQTSDPSKPPPVPGSPEAKAHRRATLVKSLGMRMVGARGKKTPPPAPIPKGTKIAGVDLAGSKGESIFGGDLYLWEDCGCGCNGKKGGCGKAMKSKKNLDDSYWT